MKVWLSVLLLAVSLNANAIRPSQGNTWVWLPVTDKCRGVE